MRSVDDHRDAALALGTPLAPVRVPLLDALGCVLAEEVTAAWPLPSFDNTSMDGYAVRAADLAGASESTPVTLPVIDDVAAGHLPSRALAPGSAIRIMTGARIPEGADAVVPVEWTDGGTEAVAITLAADPGAHVRIRGEDVREGDPLIPAGIVVTSRQVALLAAAGRGEVSVHPRPHVAVLSTGDELVEPGQPLAEGRIADSNSFMLMAAVIEAGGIPHRAGPVRDDEQALRAVLEAEAARSDLIISTGGVSMGAYDTVKSVLSQTGSVEFVKVAMQPGMPQGLGHVGEAPIVTLPGNPVSAYVSFEVFVRPLIRRLRGCPRVERARIDAICGHTFNSPADKTQFARVTIQVDGNGVTAIPEGSQGSHILGGLARAHALAVVPPGVTRVEQGDPLVLIDLSPDD